MLFCGEDLKELWVVSLKSSKHKMRMTMFSGVGERTIRGKREAACFVQPIRWASEQWEQVTRCKFCVSVIKHCPAVMDYQQYDSPQGHQPSYNSLFEQMLALIPKMGRNIVDPVTF